jgi:drug/metabolite transporter (DMT)-like permease
VSSRLAGRLYGFAQILQTVGLAHTDASVSGFVTGTYVVLTPVFTALLLRERVPASTWYAVLLATAGLALLSLNGFRSASVRAHPRRRRALCPAHHRAWASVDTQPSHGDVGRADARHRGGLCRRGACPTGWSGPRVGQWGAVVYMATAAGVLALWAQTWAQAHMPATRAAIVMTLEPVFAAGFAVAFGGESTHGWRMLVGGASVLAAMYTVELVGRRRAPNRTEPEACTTRCEWSCANRIAGAHPTTGMSPI